MNRLAIFSCLYAVVLAGLVVATPSPARAHVLISDTQGNHGTILHITPDDDPIAGQASSLFFDISGARFNAGNQPTLRVTSLEGASITLPVIAVGSTVSASHIFPQTGVYSLRLDVDQGMPEAYSLTHDIRVSRGVGQTSTRQNHFWAESMLLACLTVLAVLGVVGFNRRQAIAANSR